MMTTALAKQRLFLSSPRFAVVGASKDPSKFGTKVGHLHILFSSSDILHLGSVHTLGLEMVPGAK